MDKRWVYFFLVFFVGYFIVVSRYQTKLEAWQAANAPEVEQTGTEPLAEAPPGGGEVPSMAASPDRPEDAPSAPVIPPSVTRVGAPVESVQTGFAHIDISTVGAVPVRWEILPSENLAPILDQDTGEARAVDLIPQVSGDDREVPLLLEGATVRGFNDVVFDIERREGPDGEIVLVCTSPPVAGMVMTKTYTFPRESYLANLELEMRNGASRVTVGHPESGWGIGWQGGFFHPEPVSRLTGQVQAIAAREGDLRTKSLGLGDDPYTIAAPIAWAGQQKKYFAAVLVPSPGTEVTSVEVSVRGKNVTPEYRSRRGIPEPMSVVLNHPGVELAPGGDLSAEYALFVGPKDYELLKTAMPPMAEGALPLSRIAFGQMIWGMDWIRPISIFLLWALRWFEALVGNWGTAIIVLVLVVKTVLYPLSHWAIKNQARTMAEQQKIKPFVEELNTKYKDDPGKKSQELMKLYREHNINPLGALRGCFPMLLQMPIFFGLYILLDQAVELRGQPFLWVHDLSMPDRLLPFGFTIPLVGWDALNLLPLLMAGTQYITSRMMMSSISDPMQKQIMVMMPIMFTVMLYNMPAGLMLYWTVQNIWQIGHTAMTKRYVAMHDTSPPVAAAVATGKAR